MSYLILAIAIAFIVFAFAGIISELSTPFIFSIAMIILAVLICLLCIAIFVSRLLTKQKRRRHKLKTGYLGFIGVFVALLLLYVSVQSVIAYQEGSVVKYGDAFSMILSSAFCAIRNFFGDGDFGEVLQATTVLADNGFPACAYAYRIFMALLFVVSPIFSVGIALTFFVNMSADIKYALSFNREAYIFSELNERSLALASSLRAEHPKAVLVFTHVIMDNEQRYSDLIERAEDIGAIFFEHTITRVDFAKYHRLRPINFMIIGDSEEENLSNLVCITAKRKLKDQATDSFGYDYDRCPPRVVDGETKKEQETRRKKEAKTREERSIKVYIFSNDENTGKIAESIKTDYLKIRKVGDSRSLINKFLYEDGGKLFKNALLTDEEFINPITGKLDKVRKIKALILGGGQYGFEMAKALTWFCQMYPYKVEIVVYDKTQNVESRFKAQAPELIFYNGITTKDNDFTKNTKILNVETDEGGVKRKKLVDAAEDSFGDAHYSISFVSEVDVESAEFDDLIQSHNDATFIWVALGDDDLNMKVTSRIRMLYARMRMTSDWIQIETEKKKKEFDALKALEFAGQLSPAAKRNVDELEQELKIIESQGVEKKINYFLPDVYSVVYNPQKVETYGVSNIFGENEGFPASFNKIKMVGSLQDTYTEGTVIKPEYEKHALERHKKWQESILESKKKALETETDPEKIKKLNEDIGKIWIADHEKEFWSSLYGYYSSLASAIHGKYKNLCRQPGYCKGTDAPGYYEQEGENNMPDDRGAGQDFNRKLEHMRWNAYVRSEGYVFHDKKTKSHVAKIHRCLVPFNDLPLDEQEKDDD